jgi:hypothetical protein
MKEQMIGAGGGELDEFMKRWPSYIQWRYVRIPIACFECYRHSESWLAENS